MTLRTLVALLAAGAAAPALAVDPPVSAQKAPIALKTPLARPEAKVRGSSLTVPNVAGVPGEKRTLTAILTEAGTSSAPIAGKLVSFQVSGNGITPLAPKAGETDAQGKATASLTLPDLPQGSYDIHAAWKGEAAYKPATGSGKLTVIKAPTKIDMDFVYGTYKNEPGKYASFSAKVVRGHDNQILKKPITLTVNGDTRTMPAGDEYHSTALPDAPKWVVKVQFEGDASYAASAAEKTYVKPKS